MGLGQTPPFWDFVPIFFVVLKVTPPLRVWVSGVTGVTGVTGGGSSFEQSHWEGKC